MEWLSCVRETIDYIEEHLLDEVCAGDVVKQTYISPMLFQKGFQVLTGYTTAVYIRSRRLYLAALELQNTDTKVIDIALKYGFETPESFTKAFAKFHGSNPTQVRQGAAIRPFLPLKISISVQGGDQIDCKIKTIPALKVVGYTKEFSFENAREMIPAFWDEIVGKDSGVGEYAICIDDIGENQFQYMIARKYEEKGVPDGMCVYEFPTQEWAVFECRGENPEAIQRLSEQIWKEWLPGNPDYELSGKTNVEWYGKDNHSAVWIPVRPVLL